MLEHTVPASFFDAAAKNEVLQVVVLLGALRDRAGPGAAGRPKEMMLGSSRALAEVMFKFTGIVMKFAPIGIGAAMAVTVGHSGLGVLGNLGKLVLTLYGALIVVRAARAGAGRAARPDSDPRRSGAG